MKKGGISLSGMMIVLIVSVFVVLVVLALSLFTIQKAYRYKHTIDPPKEKPAYETQEEK
jgi:uncharacterized membrane protein